MSRNDKNLPRAISEHRAILQLPNGSTKVTFTVIIQLHHILTVIIQLHHILSVITQLHHKMYIVIRDEYTLSSLLLVEQLPSH